MPMYDLCLAWEWQYDEDFVRLLETACFTHNLTLLQVTPATLEIIMPALESGQVSFRMFWDRATDVNAQFLPLLRWANEHAVGQINPNPHARSAWNKAVMHQAFTSAGLNTPATIVLPSFETAPDLAPPDLSALGERFSIKPAHGGGGRGVITQAAGWDQVLAARQSYPADQYLLQAQVYPAQLRERSAWFRVLYCCDLVFPSWWDTTTHVYTPVRAEEMAAYHLHALGPVTRSIARLSQLELFSTEIALTPEGSFVIVDYINDPVDLRLQSICREGVPDPVAVQLAGGLAAYVRNQITETCPDPVRPVHSLVNNPAHVND